MSSSSHFVANSSTSLTNNVQLQPFLLQTVLLYAVPQSILSLFKATPQILLSNQSLHNPSYLTLSNLSKDSDSQIIISSLILMAGANLTLSPTAIQTAIYTACSYLGHTHSEYKIREMFRRVGIALPAIQAAVKMAERRAPQNRYFKNWLNHLKAAVWNVEDVLDDFEAEEIRKELKSKGCGFVSFSVVVKAVRKVILRDKNVKRLEKAVGRLQLVCYAARDFRTERFNDEDVVEGSTSSLRKEIGQPPKHLFGRNREIESILNIILTYDPSFSQKNEDKRKSNTRILGVLPIVGLSGMGKTALAQAIYNDERVKQHFVLRAWVSVSDDLCCEELVEETMCSFKSGETHTTRGTWQLHVLKDRLAAIVRDKRFLLVLDDVWDGEMSDRSWNSLLSVLKEGAPGSFVLVTTQSQRMANFMRTFTSVTLDTLSWDDFWELFKYYAFDSFKLGGKETSDALLSPKGKRSLLEAIGEEIGKKLNCSPLEAVRIGSLLSESLDVEHWMEIACSDLWTVNDSSEQVSYLGAAYQNLDMELKQSLIYCAMFPRGYIFHKNKVVQMWISHGFVRGMEDAWIRLEDIGGERFDMLVDRFFFQPVSENGYVMHSSVRDLAAAVLPDEFCNVDNDLWSISKFARHLALSSYNFGILGGSWCKKVLGDNRHETLRTLLFFGDCRDHVGNALASIFKTSSSLRVLDLSHMRIGTQGFLDIFAQLPHLRFLDLSYTGIISLPKSICDLYHLEVLNLRGCSFTKLPKRFNNLISLRHLYASPETVSLIAGIGKLTNLQELEEFSLRPRKGYQIDELRCMKRIRGRLCISNLQCVKNEKEAIQANLAMKNHLDCLVMKWDSNCEPNESYMRVAEKLQPPSFIRRLEILNYPWTRFPSWMEGNLLRRTRRVEIVGGSLEVLPPLGQMPFLITLILKNLTSIKKIEPEFYGSSEEAFPLLSELYLIGMEQLEEWDGIEERRLFPYLEKLTISSCPALKSLPNNLPRSLKEVQIINCSEELRGRYTREVANMSIVLISPNKSNNLIL